MYTFNLHRIIEYSLVVLPAELPPIKDVITFYWVTLLSKFIPLVKCDRIVMKEKKWYIYFRRYYFHEGYRLLAVITGS